MPVTFSIREDGWVAYYTFTDFWTLSELVEVNRQDIDHRVLVKHPVHWMLDAQHTTYVPPGILRVYIDAPMKLYPDSGDCVIFGVSPFMRTMAKATFRLMRNSNMYLMDSETEAWAFIRERIKRYKTAEVTRNRKTGSGQAKRLQKK